MIRTKKVFSTELCYVFGMIILALGCALMEAADFGVSMVVAPAYILYRFASAFLPFVTFGMAEYLFQAFLLLVMVLVLRKFKLSYLLSFVTAVIYGFLLDGCMALVALIPHEAMTVRFILYLFGMFFSALGISLLFHTYFPTEIYELFVKELTNKYKLDINKCKTYYDITSCILSVLLSFLCFGLWHFEGVKLGTIFCALINGTLIGACSAFLEKRFAFKDLLRKTEIKKS